MAPHRECDEVVVGRIFCFLVRTCAWALQQLGWTGAPKITLLSVPSPVDQEGAQSGVGRLRPPAVPGVPRLSPAAIDRARTAPSCSSHSDLPRGSISRRWLPCARTSRPGCQVSVFSAWSPVPDYRKPSGASWPSAGAARLFEVSLSWESFPLLTIPSGMSPAASAYRPRKAGEPRTKKALATCHPLRI